MKTIFKILIILSLGFGACKYQNHIEKYGLKIENLNKLPDNFYAYRRDRIYIANLDNLIWFDLNDSGNIQKINKITYDKKSSNIKMYSKKDSLKFKENAQEFIRLSKKYKFGHINIDRKNKIAFSYKDGLSEQYVLPLNDSVKATYNANTDFRLLDNGWFEYQDR